MAVFRAKKQYPYLITEKFNVPYTWFQPNATTSIVKSLFWLVQRSVFVYAEIYPSTRFIGTGITACNVWLMNFNNSNSATDKGNAYITQNLFETTGNNKGNYGTIRQRIYGVGVNQYTFIENRVQGEEMFLRLETNGDSHINNLTQGEFSLWITYSKNV